MGAAAASRPKEHCVDGSNSEHYASSITNSIPPCLFTDSYKITHPFQYPPAVKRVAYGEFRASYEGDLSDHRIIFYGLNHLIATQLSRPWTHDSLDRARLFFLTHNSRFTPFPFPEGLFRRIVDEFGGWLPVKIEAIEEGTVVWPHVPVYQITAKGEEFSGLVTFLETLLTMVWYPSTVATLSRRCRDVIEEAFRRSVDSSSHHLIRSRLHDFGFRGCATTDQALIGGLAHLLNFEGSDTLPAAFYAQFALNGGTPVATSIPASEHSVMTSFGSEKEALVHIIEEFGGSVFAVVMDSFDYAQALEELLPIAHKMMFSSNDHSTPPKGMLVMRPDSGAPAEMVLMALNAGKRVFGVDLNSKGYGVLRGCGVIHGDGVTYEIIGQVLEAAMNAGFSAQNVAFGMGSNLLQKVNRDTMSFATKLSHVVGLDRQSRDVAKMPRTDPLKFSLPGEFSIRRLKNSPTGPLMVYPKETVPEEAGPELLKVLYDCRPMLENQSSRPTFEQMRERIKTQWEVAPKLHDPISPELKSKISIFRQI